jgi:hypothetical protein
MDSDGDVQIPSNVTRIARAIQPYAIEKDGSYIPQLIFYQNGVGTGSSSLYVKYVGGATGDGLADNIREAYTFLCLNYVDGDEIILLGFSRGAFTARSISSLIRQVGLLTAQGMEYLIPIVDDWQYQLKDGWKTKYPAKPWAGHKPPVTAPEYQRKLLELELTRPNIPIKAVAVWDTVGGLGIPMIGLLPQPPSTDFAFVDTKVERNIEHAFQALALDEHRRPYAPTIWEKPEGQKWPKILKQTWFPGVHSDIGGSYPDTDLANLTLCWMVSQLDPFIEFEHDYVWKQVRISIEQHQRKVDERKNSQTESPHTPLNAAPITALRPWGLGKIHNSMSLFFRLAGSKVRTPGEYRETQRASEHGTLWWLLKRSIYHLTLHLGAAEVLQPRLQHTGETFHSSVRIRMGKKGLGYDDKGFYDSQALKGWEMMGEDANPDTPHQLERPGQAGAMKNVKWKKVIPKNGRRRSVIAGSAEKAVKNGNANGAAAATNGSPASDEQEDEDIVKPDEEILIIPEDEMGAFEMKILQLWPEIESEFARVRPGENHHVSIKRAKTEPIRKSTADRKRDSTAKEGKRMSRGSGVGERPGTGGSTSESASGGEGRRASGAGIGRPGGGLRLDTGNGLGDEEEYGKPDRSETV